MATATLLKDSSFAAYGHNDYAPICTTFWVDNSIAVPSYTPDGTISQPFIRVQDAIDRAVFCDNPYATIFVANGSYPDPIDIPTNIQVVIRGSLSANILLGDITFNISGTFIPFIFSGSALFIADCAVSSITIIDTHLPATSSLFILQNTSVLGDVINAGKSSVNAFFSGSAASNVNISGNLQSNQILGDVIIPQGVLNLTNTAFDGYIQCNTLFAEGCDFRSTITVSGQCELHDSVLNADITASSLFVDDTSLYQIQAHNLQTNVIPTSLISAPVLRLTTINTAGSHTLSYLQSLVVIQPPVNGDGDIVMVLPRGIPMFTGLNMKIGNMGWDGNIIVKTHDDSLINGEKNQTLSFRYGCANFYYLGSGQWLASNLVGG